MWLVARQAWFIREMTARFAEHPAVAGWLVTNEMPIYGGADHDHREVASWSQLVVDAVRAGGGLQPVSLGDGAWGLEITGSDNGFRVASTVELCDFIGPHVYRMEDDRIRQHYAAAWNCELAATFGKPVVLEEFGVTSDFTSDENGAHYYRQTLHNSLLAGVTGWIAWNNTDYDSIADQDPYRHHAFELHFGLTTADGAPKPQLIEMADFAALAATLDVGALRRPAVSTALVVPSYLDTVWPLTEQRDGPDAYLNLRQAYVSAKLADLPVAIARESEGLPIDAALYLVPSVKALLSPTWQRLRELAEGGATVYVSYFPGTHGNQRGPWYANLNSLFGVRHRLEYGLVEPLPEDVLEMTFTTHFGHLPSGTLLRLPIAGTAHSRTFLPVDIDGAQVLATDAHGRPALLRHEVGRGSVVFCTYPIEHMAASTPHANPNDSVALYEALARAAGVGRAVTVDDPLVSADVLERTDGARFLWLVNHGDAPATVKPMPLQGTTAELDGTTLVDVVRLDPFGVRVLQVLT